MDPLAIDKQVQSGANLPDERRLQLVKAIAISLGVQGHQQHLVRPLLLLLLFLPLSQSHLVILLHISINVWANCQYMSLFFKWMWQYNKAENRISIAFLYLFSSIFSSLSCTCLLKFRPYALTFLSASSSSLFPDSQPEPVTRLLRSFRHPYYQDIWRVSSPPGRGWSDWDQHPSQTFTGLLGRRH